MRRIFLGFSVFVIGMIVCVPFFAHGKIIESETGLKFTKDSGSSAGSELGIRFESFNKSSYLIDHDEIEKHAPHYTREGGSTYTGLTPFNEVWQRTDFKVSRDKTYAVIYGVRCQKPWPAATMPWKCKLNATVVDSSGYVLGDMGGSFFDVKLHTTGPLITLYTDSAGDSARYAEVYDFRGKLKNKIEDYRSDDLE